MSNPGSSGATGSLSAPEATTSSQQPESGSSQPEAPKLDPEPNHGCAQEWMTTWGQNQIVLSYHDTHGGLIEDELQELERRSAPYGSYRFMLSSTCEIRSADSNKDTFFRAVLQNEEMQQAQQLATSDLLQKYHRQDFGVGCDDGWTTTYQGIFGHITCQCECDPQKMPENLRSLVEQFDRFREQVSKRAKAIPTQLGAFAVTEDYGVDDKYYQSFDGDLGLDTLASLGEWHSVHYVSAPRYRADLEAQLQNYWQWVDSTYPNEQDDRKRNLMYLRDASGQKYIVGLAKLFRRPFSP